MISPKCMSNEKGKLNAILCYCLSYIFMHNSLYVYFKFYHDVNNSTINTHEQARSSWGPLSFGKKDK